MKRLFLCLLALLIHKATFCQQKEVDSLKTVLTSQEPIDKVKSLNELAWYYRNYDMDSAFIFANQALAIAREQKSKAAISQSLNSLANNYEAVGKLDSALLLFRDVLNIKLELNDTLGLAGAHNNLGLVYDQQSKYPESLENYFEALRIYELHRDQKFNVAMVLGNIGIVYKKQKEFEKSFEYYERALKIYEDLGSEFSQIVTKGNIGSLLIQLKQFEESIMYCTSTLEGYKRLGYDRYIPYVQSNIGIAYDSLSNFEMAEKFYISAMDGHQAYNNEYEITNVSLLLAQHYTNKGQTTEALQLATQAFEKSQQINAIDFQTKALFILSKNYFKKGDYKLGSWAMETYDTLKDFVYQKEKSKQVVEIEVKYETEKKEQQIALQQAQLETKDLQIQRNWLFITILVVSLVAILILIALLRKREQIKREVIIQEQKIRLREAQMNAVVESQENERKRFAADLHDGMGQLIAALQVNIQSIKSTSEPEKQDQLYENSKSLLKDIHTEIRNIAFNLMPQALVKEGLISGLSELAIKINKAGSIKVKVNHLDVPDLNDVAQISIYRLIQEFLGNCLKHSDATYFQIDITGHEEELVVSLEDDGMGFDKNSLVNSIGNGWRNINTRLSLIGGSLELNTHEGKKGNSVLIIIPINKVRKTLTQTPNTVN
ncbi:tetratricopeptide repeat-containing sensor histidine kinase [Fulvivirga lutea]|uniref:histidine kinase n=1 Tax=Fulvivirga lutea TaxID=2810512 RepID=A0A975A0D8_9BACT|nr:sensor histidine kinase [Fulvivirga lutea]QSE97090.1 sensor histidine kinase [Fulvivirga lutea]